MWNKKLVWKDVSISGHLNKTINILLKLINIKSAIAISSFDIYKFYVQEKITQNNNVFGFFFLILKDQVRNFYWNTAIEEDYNICERMECNDYISL